MKYRPLRIETDLSQIPALFSESWLKEFIQKSKSNFYQSLTCIDYCNKNFEIGKNNLIIRIDVDASPVKAHRMASIFQECDIKSTFFFRFHSSAYSLFDKNTQDIVRQISDTGAEIGLHCEPLFVGHDYGIQPDSLLIDEISFLSNLTGQEVKGAACHGDHVYYDLGVNNLDFWKQRRVEEFGLSYEVYTPETFDLMDKGIYVSDSMLDKWKSYSKGVLQVDVLKNPCDYIIQNQPLICVLLHPFLMELE